MCCMCNLGLALESGDSLEGAQQLQPSLDVEVRLVWLPLRRNETRLDHMLLNGVQLVVFQFLIGPFTTMTAPADSTFQPSCLNIFVTAGPSLPFPPSLCRPSPTTML